MVYTLDEYKLMTPKKKENLKKSELQEMIDRHIKNDNVDKKCSFCKVSSDNHDIVRCMGCKEEYHSCCTLQPITHEILDVIGENPSVWWFCIRCLIGSARENNDISKSEKNERLSNTEDLKSIMKEMKDSIIHEVKDMIEKKMTHQECLLFRLENLV